MIRILINWIVMFFGMMLTLLGYVYLLKIDEYIEGGYPRMILLFWMSTVLLSQLTIISIAVGLISKRFSLKVYSSVTKVFCLGSSYAFFYTPLLVFIPTAWNIFGNPFLVFFLYPIILFVMILFVTVGLGKLKGAGQTSFLN